MSEDSDLAAIIGLLFVFFAFVFVFIQFAPVK